SVTPGCAVPRKRGWWNTRSKRARERRRRGDTTAPGILFADVILLRRQLMRTALMVLVLLASVASGSDAAEIRVISAGAGRDIMTELSQAFEKQTGNTVTIEFGPVGVVRQKLAAQPADVVIMSDTALDQAIQQGSVLTGSRTDIGKTAVGIGVKEG